MFKPCDYRALAIDRLCEIHVLEVMSVLSFNIYELLSPLFEELRFLASRI